MENLNQHPTPEIFQYPSPLAGHTRCLNLFEEAFTAAQDSLRLTSITQGFEEQMQALLPPHFDYLTLKVTRPISMVDEECLHGRMCMYYGEIQEGLGNFKRAVYFAREKDDWLRAISIAHGSGLFREEEGLIKELAKNQDAAIMQRGWELRTNYLTLVAYRQAARDSIAEGVDPLVIARKLLESQHYPESYMLYSRVLQSPAKVAELKQGDPSDWVTILCETALALSGIGTETNLQVF